MNTICHRCEPVFQVCVRMNNRSIALNRKVPRAELSDIVRQSPARSAISMEPCYI